MTADEIKRAFEGLAAGQAKTDAAVEFLSTGMHGGFARVYDLFERLGGELAIHGLEIGLLKTSVVGLAHSVDGVKAEMTHLGQRMDRLEQRMDWLTKSNVEARTAETALLTRQGESLGEVRSRTRTLEERYASLMRDLAPKDLGPRA
jgi:hypothetical protein